MFRQGFLELSLGLGCLTLCLLLLFFRLLHRLLGLLSGVFSCFNCLGNFLFSLFLGVLELFGRNSFGFFFFLLVVGSLFVSLLLGGLLLITGLVLLLILLLLAQLFRGLLNLLLLHRFGLLSLLDLLFGLLGLCIELLLRLLGFFLALFLLLSVFLLLFSGLLLGFLQSLRFLFCIFHDLLALFFGRLELVSHGGTAVAFSINWPLFGNRGLDRVVLHLRKDCGR